MSHLLSIAALLTAVSFALAGEVMLPDPLVTNAGVRVTTPAAWPARRAEILEIFTREMFGRAPVARPAGMKISVMETTPGMMDGAAERRLIRLDWTGPGGTGGMNLILFVPTAQQKPAGCFLLICNRPSENIDPTRVQKSPYWPAEAIIARGYAAATFYNDDLDPDKHDEFKNGVHGVFDTLPRGNDAWGTLAAWAWGASRAIDALVEQPGIDAKRIAVVGHSRGGKTALWCGAQDERVALTISNNSGCGGAAISRGKAGENVARINKSFPHWFNANYKNWDNKEFEAPFDQHELIALCAPRLVYVASATEDAWADPAAEFRATVAATPVWQLFGLTGMTATAQPAAEQPEQAGHIGYHLRTGKHDLTEYDWQQYMNFADKHLSK